MSQRRYTVIIEETDVQPITVSTINPALHPLEC